MRSLSDLTKSVIMTWDTCLEMSPEEEKEEQKTLTEQFKPLLDWLKEEAKDVIRDGECDVSMRPQRN